ncbi:MAG: serine/threonine-protein kinase [Gemmataceae bacterium]
MTELDAQTDDARLAMALRHYQAELDAGRRPDRATLLSAYPDLAGTLQEAMDGLDFLFTAASGPRGHLALIRQLGDFRLLREIGRGGMGVVYEAEQVSLGRRVAIKVLPTASALDGRQRRRFLHEAQAAAHLHHTNIVPVFAVGCDRGVDYYAMQYIDGPTLAEIIAALKQETALPTSAKVGAGPTLPAIVHTDPHRQPSSRKRGREYEDTSSALTTSLPQPGPGYFKSLTRLGLQAARALDYAHSTGVIHRDVKPANLLVDSRSNLWVTDFGLALCHGGDDLTVTGDILGTLRYMSPEQAQGGRGRVDHVSDVYSLGVTLYELFTLNHPHPGRDRDEILRQILVEEPPPLRRARPDLPIELETVVLKAIAKSPSERYATAGELADDLGRFLDDKPVLARRPGWAQIAGKWARRHRTLVRAAVAALAFGFIGLIVALWMLESERWRTRAALGRATANWQEARRAVDTMYTEVAEKVLANDPARAALQREFLLKALSFYERFADEAGDDPAVRFERAKASVRIGEIQQKLGKYREATDAYAVALPVLEALVAAKPGSTDYRRELASAHNGRAILLHATGDPEGAATGFRRAIAEQKEVLLRASGDRKARFDLSRHAGNLGVVLLNEGRYDEAERYFLDALRSAQDYLAGIAQPSASDRQHLAHTHHNAGVVYHSTDRADLARQHWQESRRIRQELAREFPFEPKYEDDLGGNAMAMGVLSFQTRRYDEAEVSFRDAQARYAKLLSQSPTAPAYRAEHGRATHSLARALSAQGKLDKADDVLRQGQEALEKLATDFPEVVAFRLDLLRTRIDRVNLLVDAGKLNEANALAARAWAESGDGPTKLPSAPEAQYHRMVLRNNMADHAWGQGRLDDAHRWFREAAALGERLTAGDQPLAQHRAVYCGVLNNVGRLALVRNQLDEADTALRACLAHYDRLQAGPNRPSRWLALRAWTLAKLARLRERQNRPDDSASLLRAAHEAALSATGDDAEVLITAGWFLVAVPQPAGRDLPRARALAEQAVAKDATSGDGWRILGLVHFRENRPSDAVVALLKSQQYSGGTDRVTDLILAMAYKAAGEAALGDQTYDKARAKITLSAEHGEELDEFIAEASRYFGR